MGTPTNSREIANQAAIVAQTGVKREEANVLTFDRFIAMVADRPCEHAKRNGHITPEAAARCGNILALDELTELDNLDVEVDMDAKLAAVAITVVTRTRFKGLRADGTECGCPFGHRDQAAAQACVSATRRASTKALKASIPVQVAGSLAAATAAAAANKAEADKAATAAETSPETPKQAKPARKLRSGADGNTGRA